LPIIGFVLQGCRLRFDGYSTLFFYVHGIQNLRFHIPRFEPATALNQPVCKGRFAMVNMRNDGKISDVIHQRRASSD
jgi:hypothetical protein